MTNIKRNLVMDSCNMCMDTILEARVMNKW
jgi:hypothetical protein